MSIPDVMAQLRWAPATVHGRYLVRPARSGPGDLWLIGFHGYGQTAEAFFEPLARVPRSANWLVASVQALHPFYVSRTNEVVASWMTRMDREHAIADNVAYVDRVIEQLEREHGAPRALVYAGFSQGVAMAYRAGLLGRKACSAIVAAGGDLPPELQSASTRPWPRILAATGVSDEFYPPAALEKDMAFVRTRRPDAHSLVFPGGHVWSAEVVETAGELLAQLEGGAG